MKTVANDQFPLGAALRLEELERYDNAAKLRELREDEPVTWFAEQGVWLVTSKALVDEVMMNPGLFTVDVPENPNAAVLGRMMLGVDGDDHDRQRAPFADPFKFKAVRTRFPAMIDAHIDRLIASLDDGGGDLAESFANPFAVSVAGDVLGLGIEHVAEVHEIYGEFAHGVVNYKDPEALEQAGRASERLWAIVEPNLERLRGCPDGSTLAAVLNSDQQHFRDEEELFSNLRVILFGAIETVESMILNTTWALLHNPDQLTLVLAEPDLWPDAVQEGLRWIPPVGYSDRWAIEDTELAGVAISAGDYLIPVIHSANRDPAAFPDPDAFLIGRPNARQNLSFGKGKHMCLGVNLARLQGAMALRALFERLPGLRLDESRPAEPVGFNFRRPEHLHILWDA